MQQSWYSNQILNIDHGVTFCTVNLIYLNILTELNGLHDKSKNAEKEKVHKLTGNVLKSFDVFLLCFCFVLSCFVYLFASKTNLFVIGERKSICGG